jgi:hypothetical protein
MVIEAGLHGQCHIPWSAISSECPLWTLRQPAGISNETAVPGRLLPVGWTGPIQSGLPLSFVKNIKRRLLLRYVFRCLAYNVFIAPLVNICV